MVSGGTIGGMKEGGKKVMNMRKTSEVLQGQMRVPASSMSICVRPSPGNH
jgi:hypothetical protein